MIDRMTQIEMKIDHVIAEYFQPKRRKEFDSIILNSAILSTGCKNKVLENVSGFDKNTIKFKRFPVLEMHLHIYLFLKMLK